MINFRWRLTSFLGHAALASLALLHLACGASSPEPAEPSPSPAQQPAHAAEPADPPKPAAQPETTAQAESPAEAEPAEEESAPVQRNVLFKVTESGLVVDVDGVRFKPKAEPVKKPNGSYGIRVTVEAETTDDDTHVLLSPENGPLSFAALIYDKSGAETARYGDERSGDDQQFIMPGGPLTFTREWPSGSVKGPLWWGQKVTLQVGLWGLGRANEQTRPMKKFFVVELVGGAKTQAVIAPPISGSTK